MLAASLLALMINLMANDYIKKGIIFDMDTF